MKFRHIWPPWIKSFRHPCYGNINNNALHWEKLRYNLHNRLSADFPSRVLLINEALPWSLKKPQSRRLYFVQQDLSASLRNKSCKRLRSRPKRSITLSIKPFLSLLIFSRWTLITHKPDKRSTDIYGPRKGGQGGLVPLAFWNLTFSYQNFNKKCCFLSFEW